MMQAKKITEGEFAGWSTWPNEPFEHDTAGPFYLKQEDDGSMVAAFRAERKHMNAGGVVHGGALMTFADFALFEITLLEETEYDNPDFTSCEKFRSIVQTNISKYITAALFKNRFLCHSCVSLATASL